MLYAITGEYYGESMQFEFTDRGVAEDEYEAFVEAGAINVSLTQFEFLGDDAEFGPIFGDITTLRSHNGY